MQNFEPSGATRRSCGPIVVFRVGMSIIRISWWVCPSTTATRPSNSQLNNAILNAARVD